MYMMLSNIPPELERSPRVNRHDVLQMHIPLHCVDLTYHNRDLLGCRTQQQTLTVHLGWDGWGNAAALTINLLTCPPPHHNSTFLSTLVLISHWLLMFSDFPWIRWILIENKEGWLAVQRLHYQRAALGNFLYLILFCYLRYWPHLWSRRLNHKPVMTSAAGMTAISFFFHFWE